MFSLKKWSLVAAWGGCIGLGECYGNPEFFDGTFVRTSRIERTEVDDEKEQLRIFTMQDECYILGYADINSNEGYLDETRQTLKIRNIAVDLEKCVALKEQKVEATKKRLMDMLNPNELYVAIASGWDVIDAYFKTQKGELIPVPFKASSGMLQDSIRVEEVGICNWRIYTSCFLVRPYMWSENVEAVRVESVGSDFMLQGAKNEILCKSGEITVLKRKEFVEAGLFSADAPIKRSPFPEDGEDIFGQ